MSIKVKAIWVNKSEKTKDFQTVRTDIGVNTRFLEGYVVPELRKAFARQFEEEGNYMGSMWKPLAPATVKERNRLKKKGGMQFVPGFTGAHPILQRTGELKRSFEHPPNHIKKAVAADGKGEVEVGSRLTVKSGEYLAAILTKVRPIAEFGIPDDTMKVIRGNLEDFGRKHLKKIQ